MRLPANPGDQVPRDRLTNVAERLRAVERDGRELAARAGELTGAVIRRGLLRILDGGGLIVEGTTVDYAAQTVLPRTFGQFRWGAMPDDPKYNRPDGSLQQAWLAYRDDGTLAMAIAELRANDGQYAQAVLWFDRAGNIIFSEDTNSGFGIARPHVGSGTLVPTDTSRWLQGVETTWTAIGQREYETQNPRLEWNVQTLVDAGVTAEYRWVIRVGTDQVQIGDVATLTATADTYKFGQFMGGNVPLPTGVQINQRYIVQLQVRITAGQDGTKVAKATCLNFGGDQS